MVPGAVTPCRRYHGSATQRGRVMFLNLRHIGQIALPVSDVDRSEAFYADVLGLPKLYRFGDLTFFDCAGVRLLLEKATEAIQP
jgi:catechol-2,3-dioxygenase